MYGIVIICTEKYYPASIIIINAWKTELMTALFQAETSSFNETERDKEGKERKKWKYEKKEERKGDKGKQKGRQR